jgi:tRNA nucleotidyltransferase (CCA-adding enzyme)
MPLSGSLPDMTSDTERYLQLQQCYSDKAAKDREDFVVIVNELLGSIGKESVPSDSQEIEMFCKFARTIQVIRMRTIAEELVPTAEQGSKLCMYCIRCHWELRIFLILNGGDGDCDCD